MNPLSHPRRRIPDGSAFTKKVAEQRRVELVRFVLAMIPPGEFLEIMQAPRPASIPELISFARERAAETPLTCPHCNKPFTPGEP
jgi:hypothetical protein